MLTLALGFAVPKNETIQEVSRGKIFAKIQIGNRVEAEKTIENPLWRTINRGGKQNFPLEKDSRQKALNQNPTEALPRGSKSSGCQGNCNNTPRKTTHKKRAARRKKPRRKEKSQMFPLRFTDQEKTRTNGH